MNVFKLKRSCTHDQNTPIVARNQPRFAKWLCIDYTKLDIDKFVMLTSFLIKMIFIQINKYFWHHVYQVQFSSRLHNFSNQNDIYLNKQIYV